MPTLPGVVQTVVRMVESENTNTEQVGELISRDQVLSAKILRMVNSPFYGFPGRISSIPHALVLLGFNVVKGLVLTTTVFDTLAKETRGLWEHSLGTAVLSRRIALHLELPEPDEVLVAGLLHDIGKVVLSYLAPDDFQSALKVAQVKHCHIGVAEREVFGVDHTRVALWMADKWHLPERLNDGIACHHNIARAEHSREIAAVVQLADILARGMGYGNGGDPTVPPIDRGAFKSLGLTFEALDAVIREAEADYVSGAVLFAPGT